MPWRSFINSEFETYTTTDMSQQKCDKLKEAGWREASVLQYQLAQLCRPYSAEKVLSTLQEMIKEVKSGNSVDE